MPVSSIHRHTEIFNLWNDRLEHSVCIILCLCVLCGLFCVCVWKVCELGAKSSSAALWSMSPDASPNWP